ncbi:uncharacterized protein CEXT_315361 [Caerostris extrusa]|uniref:Uncharacterized protein n=1 Tax=Caerostris extrusa TaxID=172846 RepID=A0AAV4QI79_CAEEX|nr:uncharacterized protein CEXT_315361 [Caerostris extrusa]
MKPMKPSTSIWGSVDTRVVHGCSVFCCTTAKNYIFLKGTLLGHMLDNEFIPKPFKKRLKAAATHGRHNSGKCGKFFCHYVDNNWDFTSTYPQTAERPVETHSPQG